MTQKRKVFIIGYDEFNLAKLMRLPEAEECEFLPAVLFSEMLQKKGVSISGLLELAEKKKSGSRRH